MTTRVQSSGRAIGLFIAWMLVAGAAVGLLLGGSTPGRAAVCDQGGSLITGTWTISTTQVCTGILYTVDGSVNIGAGGSLTLTNGGLSFAKDTSHEGYALTVSSGGTLILDNSIVTTQTTAIAPFLKLALTVTGPSATFTMRNGAMLKFPGWFNATSATISLTGSTITGFTPGDITGTGLYVDDNDDSPVISWTATSAALYRSQIERIYENASAAGAGGNATGLVEGNVTLLGGSNLYAYDSYIGVDYSNVVGLHNELQVDLNSNAFLYNVTIDRSQDPVSEMNWQPAYVPLAAGGNIYLLRWARVTVVDSTGFPVSGAKIWSALSPVASTAQYPDNSLLTTPSAATLAYLGRSASGPSAWNATDASGNAVIPLYTDQITTASLPNAFSFGNYQLTASYNTSTVQGGVFFPPYPANGWLDNNRWVLVLMSNVQVRTGPDLALHQGDYVTPKTPIQNQPFTVTATIYNQGQTPATNFAIAAYLDTNTTAVAQVGGLSLAALSQMSRNLTIPGIATVATHTVHLVVDPTHTVPEGGITQESNNFANVTVNVQSPPAGNILISGPDNGATVEPGGSLTVTGIVRALDTSAISGVVLTVQVKSGANVILDTTTQSQSDGSFLVTLQIPGDAPVGPYTLSVTSSLTVIGGDSRSISIARPASFITSPVPFLGIPWWMFLIILAAIAAVFVGVTLYLKVFGLGKMVECGECGAFIPEDSTVCPKCGVEFEKDMAKCSNCQAWIPVDVKECPECGVQFATGQLDMTDYQEKMRLQYDEVVTKFKGEAQRQLGRSLSDTEFQSWWRTQPSFVTFEDWLREEEDLRKQGSKPCPVCGTLNSVTAKVCHKCGSMMKEPVQRPPTGGGRVMAPRVKPARAPAAAPSEDEGSQGPSPPQAVSPVVVQKKVVRVPPPEGGTQGEDTSQGKQDDL